MAGKTKGRMQSEIVRRKKAVLEKMYRAVISVSSEDATANENLTVKRSEE